MLKVASMGEHISKFRPITPDAPGFPFLGGERVHNDIRKVTLRQPLLSERFEEYAGILLSTSHLPVHSPAFIIPTTDRDTGERLVVITPYVPFSADAVEYLLFELDVASPNAMIRDQTLRNTPEGMLMQHIAEKLGIPLHDNVVVPPFSETVLSEAGEQNPQFAKIVLALFMLDRFQAAYRYEFLPRQNKELYGRVVAYVSATMGVSEDELKRARRIDEFVFGDPDPAGLQDYEVQWSLGKAAERQTAENFQALEIKGNVIALVDGGREMGLWVPRRKVNQPFRNQLP